ncbi:hypothetical protein FACS1894141_1770 [Spirochaetia bacterium]|nr:hypothetical protein FACS1894141_1770 [Spirochaetia bacterium]
MKLFDYMVNKRCAIFIVLIFICLSVYPLNAEQVRDHNNNGHIDDYDVARSRPNDYFWRKGSWYYLNQGDINYARNVTNYSGQNQKTQGGNGRPVLIIIAVIVGIYIAKKALNYYKEKKYQERIRQEQQARQRFEEMLAQKEREYQEQLRRQRSAPPPKAPPQPDMVSFYRNMLGLRLQFTQDELKNAYRGAVKKYHPDKYTGASERDRENAEMLMRQVVDGYEALNKLTI